MIPYWFQKCIYWMKSVIWRHLLGPIYFFSISANISREQLKWSICQGDCFYFTTLVAIIHIITSGLRLIREKLNDMFIWGKTSYSSSFKGAYSFHRASCSNICLISAVLDARKFLQPPHCFLANKLICNFTTIIAAIYYIKCSKFFWRAVVDICICKGDFRNNYFLQRIALS